MIRVHIAHDNPLFRESLTFAVSAQPDMKVVEASPEGEFGLERVDDSRADVLVLCVPLREEPFEEATRYRQATPTTRIVGLYRDIRARDEMLAAGVDAVVDEIAGLTPLLLAIRHVTARRDAAARE